MPDNLALNKISGDSAKGMAVAAERIQSNYKNRTFPRFQAFDQFDQPAQPGMLKDHHIAGPDALQEDGDFGHQHKIPIPVKRVKTVTRDLDDLQQHRSAVRGLGKRSLRRAYRAL